MPAFIRYPFFGCVILALSACSGSGSSRLFEPTSPDTEDADPASSVQEIYSSVEYLITDIPAAAAKFRKQVYEDADGNKYLLTDDQVDTMDLGGVDLPMGVETTPDFADLLAVYVDADGNEYLLTPTNVANMNLTGVNLPEGVTVAPDFASLTKVREGATASTSTSAGLNEDRSIIIARSSRYLSTGAVLARTDGDERRDANCEDATGTGPAKCVFEMDSLREETIFHLGFGSSTDENRVSIWRFMADREPVMSYRDVEMSQVRTTPSQDADRREIYKDADGNEYLLTSDNIADMNLDDVELPMGVTTAPAFADLLAVYEDADGNEYLLTPENVASMNLEGVDLPTGVTTAPDFASLSKVRESQEGGREEYVGYEGMLTHSMFFVGVYRFFDDADMLEHTRFENASLGRIYDEDDLESGIQNPSVALTGKGVMAGMERRINSLESHLVQGDVNIMYDPSVAADDTTDPPTTAADAMVDISITNIQRLADNGEAWYATAFRQARLSWTDLDVMESQFEHTQDDNPTTADPGTLIGSFYGTEAAPEVGGVFHHKGGTYEIIGSFGSRLDPVPENNEN